MATVFEKIWSGDISEPQPFRSDQHGIMVVLDASPATRGHAVVVPAEPIENWLDLPEVRQLQVSHVAHIFSKHMKAVLRPAPNRVNPIVIGYGVPHVHYQLVPSYVREDTRNLHDPARLEHRIDPAERDQIAAELAVPAEFIEEADTALSAIAKLRLH